MRRLIYASSLALILLGACTNGFVPSAAVGDDAASVSAIVSLRLPPWDAPKTASSLRVVDPRSSYMSFYADNIWLGDFPLSVDADNVGTATVNGLEARTYAAGSLEIEIKDPSDAVLTAGNNLGEVTLSAQGSNQIELTSLPVGASFLVVPQTGSDTLADGDLRYYEMTVTAGNTYRFSAVRTSSTGDLDVYLFNERGILVNDQYAAEAQNESLDLYFAPEFGGTYYAAVKSYAGAGDADYDYEFADETATGEYTISGKLSFPAAIAGKTVYFRLGSTIVYQKKVARTGDTEMYYVTPALSSGLYGVPSVFIDNDGDGASTVDDYAGNYGSSLSMTGHKRNIDVNLSLQIGIRGTITIPVPQDTGYRALFAVVNEYGWPLASYTPYYPSSSLSSFNYEIFAEPGKTVRVLYVVDLDDSGWDLSSVSNPAALDAFFTDQDYYWLSDPVTLSASSVSGVDGTTDWADFYPAGSFSDWLLSQ